jgi:hypothetical protein
VSYTSQNKFWPAKAHVASNLFMGHKHYGLLLAGPLLEFCFFDPYIFYDCSPYNFFSPYCFSAHTISPYIFFRPYIFFDHTIQPICYIKAQINILNQQFKYIINILLHLSNDQNQSTNEYIIISYYHNFLYQLHAAIFYLFQYMRTHLDGQNKVSSVFLKIVQRIPAKVRQVIY